MRFFVAWLICLTLPQEAAYSCARIGAIMTHYLLKAVYWLQKLNSVHFNVSRP